VSGGSAGAMGHVVRRAHEWVLVNQAAITQACGGPAGQQQEQQQQGGRCKDWGSLDLHVHIVGTNEGGEHYMAVVVVAMLSFFLNRYVLCVLRALASTAINRKRPLPSVSVDAHRLLPTRPCCRCLMCV
jgi:hypothetical protein